VERGNRVKLPGGMSVTLGTSRFVKRGKVFSGLTLVSTYIECT
jgi:hypothetical protein